MAVPSQEQIQSAKLSALDDLWGKALRGESLSWEEFAELRDLSGADPITGKWVGSNLFAQEGGGRRWFKYVPYTWRIKPLLLPFLRGNVEYKGNDQ